MQQRERRHHRSAELWTVVMRQGRSLEEVAREFSMTTGRLERLLIAFGRRRARQLESSPG